MASHGRAAELGHRLAVWSDGVQSRAAKFVEAHSDLLLRDIKPAQLHGLQNVVASSPNVRAVRSFADHQAEKAARAGRQEVERYWGDLRRDLDSLKRDAEALLTGASGAKPDAETLESWHQRMMTEFVQHLVAHSLFLRLTEQSGSSRPRR